MTDSKFLSQFEGATLDRADWTHEAHVRMAWLYVARTGSYRDARLKARRGIKRLSAAFLARDLSPCRPSEPAAAARPSVGFHETITTAFVRLIAARFRRGESFAAFRDRNPDLLDRKLSALLAHYSPELLFSEPARAKFVEPDREPLPKPWRAAVAA